MSHDAKEPGDVKHYRWNELSAIEFGFVPLNAGADGFYSLRPGSGLTTETQAIRIIQRRLSETGGTDIEDGK